MAKRYLPLFCIAASMFVFTACQKEDATADIPSWEQNPENYLNSLGQPVFFQYDYQNEAAGIYYGWFIDSEGAVKTYELSNAAEAAPFRDGGTWTPDQLRRLYNLAVENRHRLSPRELAQMVRRIRAAANGRITERVENGGRAGRGTFRAFFMERQHVQAGNASNTEGCNSSQSGNTPHQTSTVEEVKVVLLKTAGSFDQENLSEDAKALTRWLESVASNAGL